MAEQRSPLVTSEGWQQHLMAAYEDGMPVDRQSMGLIMAGVGAEEIGHEDWQSLIATYDQAVSERGKDVTVPQHLVPAAMLAINHVLNERLGGLGKAADASVVGALINTMDIPMGERSPESIVRKARSLGSWLVYDMGRQVGLALAASQR